MAEKRPQIIGIAGTTHLVMASEDGENFLPVAACPDWETAQRVASRWNAQAGSLADLKDEAERVRILNLLPGSPAVAPQEYRTTSVPVYSRLNLTKRRKR